MPGTVNTVTLNLADKTAVFSADMAIREVIDIRLKGYGTAVHSNLRMYVTWRNSAYAECLIFTVLDATTYAGSLSLNTVPLVGLFDRLHWRNKRTFELSLWDTSTDSLLMNMKVQIMYNPWAPGMPVPTPLQGTGVKGTMPYSDGMEWTGLAPGTTKKFLKTKGSGFAPEWSYLYIADIQDLDLNLYSRRITRSAIYAIPKDYAVRGIGDTTADICDAYILAHCDTFLGVSAGPAEIGEFFEIIVGGPVGSDSFNLTQGRGVFVGNNGGLTQVEMVTPPFMFAQRIGTPVHNKAFIMDRNSPIVL